MASEPLNLSALFAKKAFSFDALTSDYWDSQIGRIQKVVSRLAETESAVVSGRVLPENDSLVIGEGRRLSMAVMFLDICSFSSRPSATQGEQELLLKVLNLFFTEMVRIAEDYGGEVEKNTGDGLMAYFPDTSEYPDCGAKRAVACALTMFYVNEQAISAVLRNSQVTPIQFRIGIDHGQVTIARLGAARRFNSLVAVGAPANIACKMMSKADPDEILLGETMIKQLPAQWIQFCNLKLRETGWVYVSNQVSYPFYRYTGRWTRPQ